jgi:TATA-binding protein-associated factor
MMTDNAETKPLQLPDFPNFSIQDLVSKGNLLLASSGKEFVKPAGILSSAQEVKKARKDAMSRLGLGFLDGVEDDMDLDREFAADMEVVADGAQPITPKDETRASSPMSVCPAEPLKEPSPSTGSATPTIPSSAPDAAISEADMAALSARERNRLKRKRKAGNSAFVAPPPQTAGSRYAAAASGPAK